MAGYDNTNKGALFKNEKTKDTQPDYKGSVNVEGTEYWFSGWIRTAGPNAKTPGAKFLSVSVEAKDNGFSKPNPAAAPPIPGSTAQAPRPNMFEDMDDDIPFNHGVA